MVFGHRNFWLLFRILKLIYFPTITNEETYVARGGSEIVFLVGFRKSAPGLYAHFSDKRREAKAAFRKASNTFYTNISDKLINPNTSQKSYWKLTKMAYGNKVSNGIHNIMCGDRLMTTALKWLRVLTPILQSSIA